MNTTLRVLVVDDERLSRETSVLQLRKVGHLAEAVANAYEALDELSSEAWDVVLCDLRMPGRDGLSLLQTIRDDYPEVDVVLMTAYGTVETAVQAMHLGAADFLTKPFRFDELHHRLMKIAELRDYRAEVRELRDRLADGSEETGIVGRSRAMSEVIQLVRAYADHDASVLITGETGTGKEVVARALHRLGSRRELSFVPVPCGAIPAELAESELFGHERGAFTGAAGRHQGAFERASGGTLLLDDVDDLPLPIQAKLLRALQEGRFARVGGEREVAVDVRVVATTKVSLADAVAAGEFRDDLFYRLRRLEIQLPPLAVREDDVLLLAEHFLHRIADKNGREPRGLSPAAADALRGYSWPGNVRELASAIESAAIVSREGPVDVGHLPRYVRAGALAKDEVVTVHFDRCESVNLNEVVGQVERQLIDWALRRTSGQQNRAAEILGLPRTTLQSKLQKS